MRGFYGRKILSLCLLSTYSPIAPPKRGRKYAFIPRNVISSAIISGFVGVSRKARRNAYERRQWKTGTPSHLPVTLIPSRSMLQPSAYWSLKRMMCACLRTHCFPVTAAEPAICRPVLHTHYAWIWRSRSAASPSWTSFTGYPSSYY